MAAEEIEDTIYCIDEPELHMHSELQYRLMDEIHRIAPAQWQIWLATHSIGMVRWATRTLESEPGSAAFLDFHCRNFEKPVVIIPEKPTRRFWTSQFEVAIGELAELVMPGELFICEGDNDSDGFDASVLESIFGNRRPETAYQSVGGCNDVKNAGQILATQLGRLTPGCVVRRLFDRDDRTDEEVGQVRTAGDRVLSRREIENYLFDVEILKRLVNARDKSDRWPEIQSAIQDEIDSLPKPPRNKPADDIKSAAPKIHQILRKELALTQAGSNWRAFATEYLVPHFVPETDVYKQLESDLWPESETRL